VVRASIQRHTMRGQEGQRSGGPVLAEVAMWCHLLGGASPGKQMVRGLHPVDGFDYKEGGPEEAAYRRGGCSCFSSSLRTPSTNSFTLPVCAESTNSRRRPCVPDSDSMSSTCMRAPCSRRLSSDLPSPRNLSESSYRHVSASRYSPPSFPWIVTPSCVSTTLANSNGLDV